MHPTEGMPAKLKVVCHAVLACVVCALCTAVASQPTFAQGCAMCYTSAAAAGSGAARALDHAIIVLLAPALLLFISIVVLLVLRARAAAN